MSRWMLLRPMPGMCGFCDRAEPLARCSHRGHASLPQRRSCVPSVDVLARATHTRHEASSGSSCLASPPTARISDTKCIVQSLTRERRFWMSPLDLVSAAMLRGPYWRVSWSPRLLAVEVTEADFCSACGTRRSEGSL